LAEGGVTAAGPLAVHATALAVGQTGVLLRGPSGAGKSMTALVLIERCRERGLFARLVADDRVILEAAGGRLLAAPHPAVAGRIERRGQGIEDTPFLRRVVVGLVVDLVPFGSETPRLPETGAEFTQLLGVRAPRLAAPGDPGAVARAVLSRLAREAKSGLG
jgi:serine kinase of HPr protein (carbohydrate metabolism regulator)